MNTISGSIQARKSSHFRRSACNSSMGAPVSIRKAFLVETGAPMDELQADLRKWLLFLACMLPLIVFIALAGGYALVRRALSPVDRIATSAERISSHNLSER